MYGMKTHGILAIDYDDTYTVNPKAFGQLAENFKSLGWSVYIVTARAEGDNNDMPMFEFIDKVIFCNGKAKMDVVEADIWIDDYPLGITHNFASGFVTPNEYTKS